MARVVTYFGDVATNGNTLVFQNSTVQGTQSIFSGNVNPAVTGTTSLTTGGALFTSNSNTTTLNVTSLYGTMGLNTTGGGATLNVAGNTWTSNALSTPNVFATTSANVRTLNTAFITGPLGLVGIGTRASGATLNVAGNVWVSNALSAPNVFATTSANVTSLNTATIFGTAGRVGISTTASGWTLNVAGNAYVSNAIGAQNVFATSFANVTNLITSRIVSTTGFVGVNCAGGGATLNVAGNVWASNALAAPNVFATTSANLASLNTSAIFSSTGFVGINCAGGGARMNVLGNVYVSNALTTTNVLPTMNANIITTSVTYMNLFTAGLGINGPAQAGTALAPLVKVFGNVWCSNAFQTPNCRVTNVLAVTSNLGPTATKRIFSSAAGGIVGVGQVPTVGAATLQVTGNVFAANALQSANISTTSANAFI
jgi:hypothetical protein